MTKQLTESARFELLANDCRRSTVRILRDTDRPLSVRELARALAEDECVSPSAEDVRELRLVLHHNHLPRLDEADVVAYDWSEKTIERRPNLADLVQFVDQLADGEARQIDA